MTSNVNPVKRLRGSAKGVLKPGAGIKYIPTNAERRRVWIQAAIQVPVETIAACCNEGEGISVPTLYKYFGPLLKTASQNANAKVARALYMKALGGDTGAMCFWLKTRAGFKETATDLTVNVVKRVVGVDEKDV